MGGRRHGWRRHLSLWVSGGLVLLIGLLGVGLGQHAGRQARDVHREDRAALQQTLAGLVDTYLQLSAAEVLDHLERGVARSGPWSAEPGDAATLARLAEVVEATRALDAGAVLVTRTGAPLGAFAAKGALPERTDPGWAPLRAALRDQSDGPRLPLSGVLQGEAGPLLALALPVPLADGSGGLLLGLWSARDSALQGYVSQLIYGSTGHGYVVDGAGAVIAGPSPDLVGSPLPLAGVLRELGPQEGLLDTTEQDTRYVTSFHRAGQTGWTALTPQEAGEFEGALRRASQAVQLAVVALLLIAGSGLVFLHRKRESALRSAALHDELTGVHNRRGFYALAEHELARAQRADQPRVMLFVDVDGLKQVNDVLGHRDGDRAIVDCARVLESACRESDLVGRLGGDEFVVLLGEGGDPDVGRRRVEQALARHNATSDAAFELRLSLGAEVWRPRRGCSVEELVRRADAVMYVHKQSRPWRHEGVVRVPAPRSGQDAASRA